ncbi:hypothetical protein Hanom_Chr05g00467511 [Helianthus anomalus]
MALYELMNRNVRVRFNIFSYSFFPFDWPVASYLFFYVTSIFLRLTSPSNTRVLDGLCYFSYVLCFALISQQRACVIQKFYVCFSLSVIFFPFLFIFVLRAFSVLVVADNGIILLLFNTI